MRNELMSSRPDQRAVLERALNHLDAAIEEILSDKLEKLNIRPARQNMADARGAIVRLLSRM
jgi:hypothetical protein